MKLAVHALGGVRLSPGLRSELVRAVRTVFRFEKSKARGECNIVLTDRPTIRRLNRQFLDHSGDTDVIAFPYTPSNDVRFLQISTNEPPFGDIFISMPVARDNARRFGQAAHAEILRLAVHGALHLLGYRDHAARDKAIMWDRQERILARLTKRAR